MSMGRPVEILIEVTGYERPRRISEAIRMPATDIEGTLTFDTVSDGTRMRWSWDVEPHGALKLMTPIITWQGRRQEESVWIGLKQYREGQRSPAPVARAAPQKERSTSTIAARPPQEIASGVYRLPIRGSNVYLVRSGPTWALIDTAWGNSARAIQQAAESLFGANARPAAILLTHVHPDHVGSARELALRWNCPVYMHPDEMPLAVAGDLATLARFANPLDRWVMLPLLRVLPRRRVEAMLGKSSLTAVARSFDPVGPVPGLPDWTSVPTPGHSPEHVAYFRERDRVLIAGDAVLTVAFTSPWDWLMWVLWRRRPRVSGSPRYTNWHDRATKVSAQALARLEPRVLALGHGTPMSGPTTAAALRSFAAEREPGMTSRGLGPGRFGPSRKEHS
jgi:glyoxylase-like metal-dependent hydrolase (beta-lactamase superfamily II)